MKIEGVWKCLMIFFFTFATINQQTADLENNDYGMEWLANQDKHLDWPNISVSSTGTKRQPCMCFVNKQLVDFSPDSELARSNKNFLKFWAKLKGPLLKKLKSSISSLFTKNVLLIKKFVFHPILTKLCEIVLYMST